MARLALNKSSLTRQNQLLKGYREFLPALDMKRRQLLAEQARARAELAQEQTRLAEIHPWIAEQLPMLANQGIELDGLVQVERVELAQENVMGVRLPLLQAVEFRVKPYSFLSRPHWVEPLVDKLKQALELRIRMQLAQRRLQLLADAVRTITQRVNLFDKVLIPRTHQHIRQIRIYLADEERAAVVRAKLAKRKKR
ncbi:V-type ATP synthase subunit D [Candidatus Endoriftia persephone]|jgi:V/A-type H+-transporting ATPase subunit D|uniref:V-type ATPase, D subunit n=3 Tax=Gammaproteobacteria TaxID=1236 RepID=G2FBF5_9GAMM|nr:V-type ATP synthase subunit D [Candidatus Endoriftia persephone]EGV50214.1 V-type ATPase, D subunit [endosymbiont of Riftia pachyptila (vent Ph05)]EGW56093.1 V-type ATPase, D subunit [endosymbiont of Tevnia jerichonana (vent Tica)]USF88209.1 V-type ATP synthase subunit D [Candidatus Endoriftia persephone]